MKTFGQRYGLEPSPEAIPIDSMPPQLRNSLWNVLHMHLWASEGFMFASRGKPLMDGFSALLWFHYFKEPIDQRPLNGQGNMSHAVLNEKKSFLQRPLVQAVPVY